MTQTTPKAAPAWLVRIGRSVQPRARLICVPYAGGGPAAFRPWISGLPSWLEVWAVRAPGRESRLGEPVPADMHELVDELTTALLAELPRSAAGGGPLPYALYGHSMGAIVAFELAHTLPEVGYGGPAQLIVSGRRAPQLPDPAPPVHQLPWEQFVAHVRRLGGIPDEVFEEPGLAELVLETLLADFTVIESYDFQPRPKLACGIAVLGGDADPIAPVEQLAPWGEHTCGPVSTRVLPGGHFFINTQREAVLAALTAELSAALDRPV